MFRRLRSEVLSKQASIVLSSPSSSSSSSSSRRLPSLLQLILSSQWNQVKRILSNKTSTEIADEYFQHPQYKEHGGLFHMACRSNPPIEIIELFADLFPEEMFKLDKDGQSPLHVAVACSAKPGIIRMLIEFDPEMVNTADAHGRTPLHYACKSYFQNCRGKFQRAVCESWTLTVIRALCRSTSSSINMEDVDGMTAMEYAIESEVDLRIIKYLQRVCQMDWLKRISDSSSGHHEDVEQELTETARTNLAITRTNLEKKKKTQPFDKMTSFESDTTKRPSLSSPGLEWRRIGGRSA